MSYKLANEFIDRMVALRPELLRQAAFLIGKRTQLGSPEDFVQDTLVTALQSADRFEDENLTGWLIAILHNHVRNARRRAYVRTSVPMSTLGQVDDGYADVIDLPAPATQELTLEVEDVMAALRTLSVADQDIIWLARIDGLSHAAIGARLELPLGTLYARLSRATARLRAAYDAEPSATKTVDSSPRRRAA